MENKTETSSEAQVIEEDAILVEELLSAGVPLERTVELFRNRIGERDINRIARKIFGPENAPNLSLTKLGERILERSVTAAEDEEFMHGYISNLAEEAPDDFLDPILMTIMKDPVVLSSGLVLDRDTVLDATTGGLKFSTCPITRERLKEEVYPILFLKKKLVDFKEKKIRPMLAAAAKLVENNNLKEFIEVQKLAKDFIDSLGEATYSRHEKEVAELNLIAWNNADDSGAQLWSPAMIADNFIRLYQATPALHGDGVSEEKRKFAERLSVLERRAREALAENEPEAAETWCEACALVNGSCGSISGLAVHGLRLQIGKRRGYTEEDLRHLKMCAYCEIRHDPDAVRTFCEEEGMDAKDLEVLTRLPIGIKIKPGWYIDSITFAYQDGKKKLFGGPGGDHADIFKLEEGEMLVSVEGFQYNRPLNKYLGSYVRFGTNLNRDMLVQAAAHYYGGRGAPEGYPDNNYPIPGGQGINPHHTRDGYYYRFVNNNGIFGLKTDMEDTWHGKIVGVIDAEEHFAMVGAHLPDSEPLQNRDEIIASVLGVVNRL
mmetsp:Transcript_65525/g.77009  ORF Transcript_65525/g.77009 Transcript_65525/m.77009 type:complete len:547 (+) Transcript_65525:159-1799(+)|eukprot:CAMPEP_0194363498 /NCGR_PEP_ID=MMETSP0174-20130528/11302_1 /TAXON_ID=216777 /ORGANISM="Proboscia alata, Strain PI-D3" /LENGTH=546 /DNA_ID=CAMNT_0039136939 /DNA_START=109 /DNA_END=1749 /DNA_ORIENTATION=+